MATVVIPAAILSSSHANAGWDLPSFLQVVRFMLGGALLAAGLALFISTVALFAGTGRGTLAPWDQTQRLVVRGPYRHVRNPMISGVIFVLLAEATLFGSVSIFAWALLFALINIVYLRREYYGNHNITNKCSLLKKQLSLHWITEENPA